MQQIIDVSKPIVILLNIVGVTGVIMILTGYFLMQLEKINSRSMPYQLLNLLGSIFILLSLLVSWNLPSFIIEICWLAISSYGIIKIIRNRKHNG